MAVNGFYYAGCEVAYFMAVNGFYYLKSYGVCLSQNSGSLTMKYH